MTKHKHGFTLIELLLVIVLISVITVSVYFNFHTTLTLYSRLRHDVGDVQQFRLCFLKMEKDIVNIVPYPEILFKGDAKEIHFPAYLELYEKGQRIDKLLQVTYVYDNHTLFREVHALKKSVFDEDAGKKEIFLSDVYNFSFSFGYMDPNKKLVWQETWDADSDATQGTGMNDTARHSYTVPYLIRMNFDSYEQSVQGEDTPREQYQNKPNKKSTPIQKTFIVPIGEIKEVTLSE